MADIHILKGTLREKVGEVLSGSYQVVYHIPIDSPVAPDAPIESIVPDIESSEQDGLNAGSLLEIVETQNYNSNSPLATYGQLLKEKFAELTAEKNEEQDFRYAFYGQTLQVE